MKHFQTLVLIGLFLCLIPAAPAQEPAKSSAASATANTTSNADETEIRAVIDRQVEAWNRGDLVGYMDGYWKNDGLTFSSGATETHGWQTTLQRYRTSYQKNPRGMGRLTIDHARVEMLGPEAALVRAEWRLRMADKSSPHGVTTLIFRKLPEGWRIIHDHSSGE